MSPGRHGKERQLCQKFSIFIDYFREKVGRSGPAVIDHTVTEAFIRYWRLARLNHGTMALGYPTENVLQRVKEMGRFAGAASTGNSARRIYDDSRLADSEIVQRAVATMTDEVRAVFEAYHLGMIRGDHCLEVVNNRRRTMSHRKRALILGVSERTYFNRLSQGRTIVADTLEAWLDVVQ